MRQVHCGQEYDMISNLNALGPYSSVASDYQTEVWSSGKESDITEEEEYTTENESGSVKHGSSRKPKRAPKAPHFQCENCPKVFRDNKDLRRHHSRVHGDANMPIKYTQDMRRREPAA